MDNVRPRGSYSPIKRSYYTKPAFRPKDLKQDVKTFGVQNMTTAGTRAVVNTGKGKMDTDLKKSRWVWRPKGNYLDHVSKDSGSFMLKKDHVVVDSGCSSHMTGNKAYLSDYEDFNGGFMAFGNELKFNLFSVSQKCDKKNSVLFTESECLILSPSFKLLDESQVVLRAPRKDDVYSLDFKEHFQQGQHVLVSLTIFQLKKKERFKADIRASNIYFSKHEVHANENRTMMERFLQPTNDPLALVSNASVQQYPTQSSKSPQSSNEPSPADNFQLDSGRGQNRGGIINPGPAKPIKCYNYNGLGHIARECPRPKRLQDSDYFKDKMLLMQAQENGAVLDEEQSLFLAGEQIINFDEDVDNSPENDLALNMDHIFEADECDAFDSDVDEDRNRKGTSIKSELHSAHILLSYTVGQYKSMTERSKSFEKDFKRKEDKFLEEFLDIKRLKDKIEDRLYKQDQSVQTVHMLCKPKSFYDEKNKVAIGYKIPYCLNVQSKLRCSVIMVLYLSPTNHTPTVVHDSEDTREIAEITRKRMLLKMQSPLCVENKVRIAPPPPPRLLKGEPSCNLCSPKKSDPRTDILEVYDSPEASGSKPRSNTKKNRIMPAKKENKKKVEVHLRTNKEAYLETKGKATENQLNKDQAGLRKQTGKKHLQILVSMEDPQEDGIHLRKTWIVVFNGCHRKKFALGECVVQVHLWYLAHVFKTYVGESFNAHEFCGKFIGTVRFGLIIFGAIMGYGDYVMVTRRDLMRCRQKAYCYVSDINGAGDLLYSKGRLSHQKQSDSSATDNGTGNFVNKVMLNTHEGVGIISSNVCSENSLTKMASVR
ncbi:retrovirus-related pol polyprotein from transposon TNT 1-94 [Tanacetum coccineum]